MEVPEKRLSFVTFLSVFRLIKNVKNVRFYGTRVFHHLRNCQKKEICIVRLCPYYYTDSRSVTVQQLS